MQINIEQTCPTATFYGYTDARCYDEYRPQRYGFDSDDDKYRSGYACGMDENLKESGGIAPVQYRGMPNDPRIKALASEAAGKIQALTVAHQTQIEAIYQDFREQAANLQESNADELSTPSVTPVPQSSKFTKESQ